MNLMRKSGFSLIELLISLIIISCIMAAFSPVITKKLTARNEIITTPQLIQPASVIKSNKKEQDLETFMEILKDCKMNPDRTKLICEIELAQSNEKEDEATPSTKVTYSDRRDKIRFKDADKGNYQTSTVTKQQVQETIDNLKKLSIPIEGDMLMLDKMIED